MIKFNKNYILAFAILIILLWLANLIYAQHLEMEKIQFSNKDETELPSIEAESVVVFYEPSYDSLAHQISQYLLRVKSTLKLCMGFEPIKWRVALYEKGISVLNPPQNGNPYWLGTAIANEGPGSWFLNQVQWWTKATIEENIHLVDNGGHWFTDGLGYYISWVSTRSISEFQDKACLLSYLRSELADFYIYLQNQKDSTFYYDLTKWTPILERIAKDYNLAEKIKFPTDTILIKKVLEDLIEKKILEDIKEDRYTCELAAYFWLKLERLYGKSVISNFIQDATKLEEPTEEKLITLLSKITGRDIKKMLTIFTVKDVMTTIDSFDKELIHK